MSMENNNANITGERLKSCRENRGWTQIEASGFYKKKFGETASVSSICEWEAGKRQPTPFRLRKLAALYEVSLDYLTGQSDNRSISSNTDICLQNGMQPFSADNSVLYTGEPVWVKDSLQEETGSWGLLTDDGLEIIFPDGKKESVYAFEEGQLFRTPAQFYYGLDAETKPISRNKIQYYDTLWCEGIGGTFKHRQNVKGWYYWDKSGMFLKNDTGRILTKASYGKEWIAFEEPI